MYNNCHKVNAHESYLAKSKCDSKTLHDSFTIHDIIGQENHTKLNNNIKSIFNSALKNILIIFSFISIAEASNQNPKITIFFGFSILFGNSIVMTLVNYICDRSEKEYIQYELRREEWEMENYMEGEINEMIEIYKLRGMSIIDSSEFIKILAKYPKIFLENMMVDELQLLPNNDLYGKYSYFENAIITLFSSLVFGSIPLITYILFLNISMNILFLPFFMAGLSTITTLYMIGLSITKFTNKNSIFTGLNLITIGCIISALSYIFGYLLDKEL